MSSSVAQDPSSRVVTRARIGFRARVTYFELGCPETNIDPTNLVKHLENVSCYRKLQIISHKKDVFSSCHERRTKKNSESP